MSGLNNVEKNRALLMIALSLLVWQTILEWTKLLTPFIQWEIKPTVSIWTISVINTVGNGMNLVGSLFLGWALEKVGFRMAGVIATVTSGLFILASSQTELLPVWILIQIFRLGDHFRQICEAEVAWIAADWDPKERTRQMLRLSIPIGLALCLGPLIGVKTLILAGSTRVGLAFAGILLFLCLLPLILFAVPEPSYTSFPRLPSLRAFAELLQSASLRKLLLFKLLVELPFQAFDTMSRSYMVFFLVQEPAQIALTIGLAGGVLLLTSTVVIRLLQRYLNPLQIIQASLAYLAAVYLLFGPSDDPQSLITLVPMQMVGTSIALSELNAQILNSAGKEEMGKVAGLSQVITLAAMTGMPVLSGHFFQINELRYVTYGSAALTVATLALVSFAGNFLATEAFRLPDASQYSKAYRD